MEESKNKDIDVINHLLQIEKESSLLINDALKEADAKLSAAHAQYNAAFKQKFDAGIAVLEAQFQSDSEKEKAKSKKEFDEYKLSLENKKQDAQAFNKVLDSLLFQK